MNPSLRYDQDYCKIEKKEQSVSGEMYAQIMISVTETNILHINIATHHNTKHHQYIYYQINTHVTKEHHQLLK